MGVGTDPFQDDLEALGSTWEEPSTDEIFLVALRRLGKRARLVRYEGEEHHLGSWSRANARDYWRRLLSWFDDYLKR